MLAAIPIELTGESFWIKSVLVLIPALLLAGAAVTAARIARRSAFERQREQLDHDSARQEKALAHDREMREEEREHDREIRSRERCRDTLDSVLANLQDAQQAVTGYAARITVANAWRPKLEKQMEEAPTLKEKASVVEKMTREIRETTAEGRLSHASLLPLKADRARLRLRFGEDHSITKIQHEIRKKLREWEALLDTVGSENRDSTDEEKQREDQMIESIGELSGRFQRACRAWDAP